MAATKKKRFEPGPGLLQCCLCRRALPPDQFALIAIKDKRCKPGHVLKAPSYDCRSCSKERKRELRRKKAARDGKAFEPRGDRRAWEAGRKEAREQALRDRRARYQALLEEQRTARAAQRALMTPEEMEARRKASSKKSVQRQRWRYNNDPEYHARMKAKKLRRLHAIAITRVVHVDREVVARRDGWLCGICGELVTRATWSLDHIVALSRGGSHTYDNVVLAHRLCNLSRGVGGTGRRLSVQAPLFPELRVPTKVAT